MSRKLTDYTTAAERSDLDTHQSGSLRIRL